MINMWSNYHGERTCIYIYILKKWLHSVLYSIKNRNPKSDALAKTHFSLIVSIYIYTYITTLNLSSLCKRKNSKRERTWEKLQCIWRRKKGKKMESRTLQKKTKKKKEKRKREVAFYSEEKWRVIFVTRVK